MHTDDPRLSRLHPWDKVLTKRDLDAFERRMNARFARLEAAFLGWEASLACTAPPSPGWGGEFGALRTEPGEWIEHAVAVQTRIIVGTIVVATADSAGQGNDRVKGTCTPYARRCSARCTLTR